MITASNIHKSFQNLQVLKGVDINIQRQEIVSIVGPSGAGKTTLLNILGTLDKADIGTLMIDNEDVSKLKNKELSDIRNRKIGFVFQFHHLLPEFTALENVCIPAFIQKVSASEAKKRALELLAYLGVKNRAEHKPSEMSGGEQQRVAVARALINRPKILFADEPSGNLDSKNAEELHKLFFSLRKDFGTTLVYVTHNKEFAEMADRKLQMKDGIFVLK